MTDNTTPTETVDYELGDLWSNAFNNGSAHHISDNADEYIADTKTALRKAFESAMEAVIGEGPRVPNNPTTEQRIHIRAIYKAKDAQRQRAKEQINLMFGE